MAARTMCGVVELCRNNASCTMTKRISPIKDIASTMRFVVRRYDSVPSMDHNGTLHVVESALVAPHPEPSLYPEANVHDTSADQPSSESDTAQDTVESLSRDISDVVKRGRSFAKRQMRRLVCKDGELNIDKGVSSKRRKFAMDFFTTLLDLKWRFIMLLFTAGFTLSWLTFAFFWWILLTAHGDHVVGDTEEWQNCVENVYDFPTALLYSIETQHTIGYGNRVIHESCSWGFVLLMCQSCFGVFVQSLLAGLIFAKLSRPKRRSRTIMFSKNAVICLRDGEFCLLFRVGDMRKSHIVGATIRAVMVRNRLTQEGELIPLCSVPLKVQAETMLPDDNFVFLAWPITVIHKIDEDSPLWDVSAEELIQEKFEIVVVLEGCIESTGMTVQLRTSYLPCEILWGHHLSPLVTYQKENGNYRMDYTQFHCTNPVSIPEKSPKEVSEQDRTNTTSEEDRIFKKTFDYPVNFTAPTQLLKQNKRTWSLRKTPGLRGSLRRKGFSSKSKCGSDGAVAIPVVVSDDSGVAGAPRGERDPKGSHRSLNGSLRNICEQEGCPGMAEKCGPGTGSTSGLGSANDLACS